MNYTSDETIDNLAEMEVSMVRIYNKELTQAEITANYDEVKGKIWSGLTSSLTGTVDTPLESPII